MSKLILMSMLKGGCINNVFFLLVSLYVKEDLDIMC